MAAGALIILRLCHLHAVLIILRGQKTLLDHTVEIALVYLLAEHAVKILELVQLLKRVLWHNQLVAKLNVLVEHVKVGGELWSSLDQITKIIILKLINAELLVFARHVRTRIHLENVMYTQLHLVQHKFV